MTQSTEPPFQAEFLMTVVALRDRPQPRLPEIAIGGRSNVGKSSLINAICGQRTLARVSKTPGRTRALNYFAVPNENFYLVDLPGYGYAKAGKDEQVSWRKVVDSYLSDSAELAGVIVLVDALVGPTPLDREFIEWLSDTNRIYRIVLTKSDQANQSEFAATQRKLKEVSHSEHRIVRTSTLKSIGIDALRHEIRLLLASAR